MTGLPVLNRRMLACSPWANGTEVAFEKDTRCSIPVSSPVRQDYSPRSNGAWLQDPRMRLQHRHAGRRRGQCYPGHPMPFGVLIRRSAAPGAGDRATYRNHLL